MNNIAVLLTCHNRREKTVNCLRSLYNCLVPANHEFNVFLVDDGSTDGTSEAVKKEFSEVNVIQGNGQLYWNRGMHLAWETAAKAESFDYYLWLNDDVELFPDSIIDLLEALNGKNAIICGTMRSKNQAIPTYGGRIFKGNLLVPNGTPQFCNAINGNLVLVPANVYKIIGNLDPLFPHTMGDFDYGFRAKKKGISSYIASNYSGYCEKNELPPIWCIPEVSFRKRFKVLYSPLGNSHPWYFFQFEKRHFGILRALKHFITIHIRLIFPQLWKR
jgi:GT2 family glycosyltransferase